MKCISRSTILLASLCAGWSRECVVVDGPRIRAGDLALAVPAFAALPPDRDLAPAPSGAMVRVFARDQLAFLAGGATPDTLPRSLCVARLRQGIPAAAWRNALRLGEDCGAEIELIDYPKHAFPSGTLLFTSAGLTAATGLWKGSLVLPEKVTIPVWVRVRVRVPGTRLLLRRDVAMGTALQKEDLTEQTGHFAPDGPVCSANAPFRPAGQVAKRNLKQGTEVKRADFRRPPAVVRGQAVELQSENGSARLRIRAVAEGDAEIGQPVRVKSEWNGSRLQARVTAAGKVAVD